MGSIARCKKGLAAAFIPLTRDRNHRDSLAKCWQIPKNPLLRHDSAACGHLCDDNSIPFLLAMSSAYNSQCLAPRDRLEKQVCLNRIHALIFFVVCFLFRLRLLYSCETFTLVSRHTTVTSSPKKNVNQQSHSYRFCTRRHPRYFLVSNYSRLNSTACIVPESLELIGRPRTLSPQSSS